ncbi:hypothetical protein VTN00DRAFT_9183 [Thermoascus crustaceus]|uniref:uncharacterized protein n=1 Tax=Thermoascus crustaceus TaxID=5088 RepID=UPI00374440F2
MADRAAVLQELDMAQYLPSFIHNGFDSWADVLDITENDLDVLGVKLGHRRRLQQRVARERVLLSQTQPGQSCQFDGLLAHEAAPRKKRKYRWHPKPDPNAPKKPLTAYAQFANEKRELRHHGLSFADMAIEIGKL